MKWRYRSRVWRCWATFYGPCLCTRAFCVSAWRVRLSGQHVSRPSYGGWRILQGEPDDLHWVHASESRQLLPRYESLELFAKNLYTEGLFKKKTENNDRIELKTDAIQQLLYILAPFNKGIQKTVRQDGRKGELKINHINKIWFKETSCPWSAPGIVSRPHPLYLKKP